MVEAGALDLSRVRALRLRWKAAPTPLRDSLPVQLAVLAARLRRVAPRDPQLPRLLGLAMLCRDEAARTTDRIHVGRSAAPFVAVEPRRLDPRSHALLRRGRGPERV